MWKVNVKLRANAHTCEFTTADVIVRLKYYSPIIVEPCEELSAVPVSVISDPISIRIDHLWLIVVDQLVHLRQTDLLLHRVYTMLLSQWS